MFKITKKNKGTRLDREIESVIEIMSKTNPYTEGYSIMAKNLEQLYKTKLHEQGRRVSPDTIAIIVGNLLGIALILGYEKANIITTKALGFVIKGRV